LSGVAISAGGTVVAQSVRCSTGNSSIFFTGAAAAMYAQTLFIGAFAPLLPRGVHSI
jgi:hypothetical protein